MVKFILKINLFILLLSLTFLTPKISRADTEIFSDDFNDGNANGWIVPRLPCSGGPWQIQGTTYGIPNPGCVTESIPSSLSIGSGLSYSFELDMALPVSTSMDRNFVFKYMNSSNWYGIHVYQNNVYLQKVVGGVEIGSPFWSGVYPFSANSIYHFKINVYPTFFEVNIDGNLLGTVYDNVPTFENLSAGLQASGSDTVWFDNVVVTQLDTSTPTPTPTLTPTPSPSQSPTPSPTPTQSPTPSPTPTATATPTPSYASLNVIDLKQYSLPWKNQIYDSANRWSNRTSIERWGCALTSASMILQFWGHGNYANPDSLNNWLKSQPDGYLGNGLINWLAVTRFSRIHSNVIVPALEYRRLGNSNSELINELNNGRPAILKEPGHFVVAKSQTADSFGINDPGYPARTTLASYGNSFQAINSFIPTHTDLSYILLTIDPLFTLKVFDSDGNEITGNTYVDEPLTDDVGGSNSNVKPLKIFEFPKPEDEKYTVEVSGKKGDYKLNTYVYDEDGNVNKSDKDGHLSKNTSKDKLTIKTTPKKNHHSQPWWFNWFPRFNPWKWR